MWVSSPEDSELLLNFQRYAGKRVQRFPYRTPNSSSFYGLGWIKLTTFIKIKKMLFVLTILNMDPGFIIRMVFESRLAKFCDNVDVGRKNAFSSPVFDIMIVAMEFGLVQVIRDMAMNIAPVTSKRAWSRLVWERAWKLDDANWRAANTIYKDNDLLISTMGDTRYLNWWRISDMDYRLVKMCETMSKIICHASLLKRDDYRLKGAPMSSRTCISCSMYCIESISHIVNQCPFYQIQRAEMYDEIFKNCPSAKDIFQENNENVLYYLLGKTVPNMEEYEMIYMWCISGAYICRMYNKAVANRMGVG